MPPRSPPRHDFTGCFLNQPGANTNVSNASLLYAGDLNRQPTGAATPALNPQVMPDTGGGTGVHVVLNSDDYWPTATTDGWTAANPGGWATSDAQKPCTVKYIDVKATDDDVPGLLKLIPFRPDIHANARLEIRKAVGFTGVLPWAVPEVDPNAVVAIFYDESNGSCRRRPEAEQGPDPQPQQHPDAAVGEPTVLGRREGQDRGRDHDEPESEPGHRSGSTLSAICGQSGATCYAGNSTSDGLALVRAITNGAAASASNPKLNAVSFGAGSCTDDTSAGYYVLNGDCNPDVTAKIDFGVANPVIAPTYARVTLTGPGCPCTMAWRQSDDTWVLNSGAPTLTSWDRPERVLDDVGDRWQRPRRRAGCAGHACRACSVRADRSRCRGRIDRNAERQAS